MPRPSWARLALPFSPAALAWVLLELSPDGRRARVAPRLTAQAVRARLDDAVTPEGWSSQLLPLGDRAVVCNLTVEGVTRSAVAELPVVALTDPGRSSAAALADTALYLCAEQFGMRAPGAESWAEHDPETGDLLVEEPDEEPDEGPVAGAAEEAAVAEPAAEPPPAPEERPEAHVVIDRLVDRLKAEGLGAQAAKLVVRYGGYGRTAEESRELYGKLRSLLVGKVAVGP